MITALVNPPIFLFPVNFVNLIQVDWVFLRTGLGFHAIFVQDLTKGDSVPYLLLFPVFAKFFKTLWGELINVIQGISTVERSIPCYTQTGLFHCCKTESWGCSEILCTKLFTDAVRLRKLAPKFENLDLSLKCKNTCFEGGLLDPLRYRCFLPQTAFSDFSNFRVSRRCFQTHSQPALCQNITLLFCFLPKASPQCSPVLRTLRWLHQAW